MNNTPFDFLVITTHTPKEFAEELLRWVRDIPAAEVKCQHPEKRKVECSLDGILVGESLFW